MNTGRVNRIVTRTRSVRKDGIVTTVTEVTSTCIEGGQKEPNNFQSRQPTAPTGRPTLSAMFFRRMAPPGFGYTCADSSCCTPGKREEKCNATFNECDADCQSQSECSDESASRCSEDDESASSASEDITLLGKSVHSEPIPMSWKEAPVVVTKQEESKVIALPWHDTPSYQAACDPEVIVTKRSASPIAMPWYNTPSFHVFSLTSEPDDMLPDLSPEYPSAKKSRTRSPKESRSSETEQTDEDNEQLQSSGRTIKKRGKLPSGATTRPGWVRPLSLSGSHPGSEDQTLDGKASENASTVYLMTGGDQSDDEETETGPPSVAKDNYGPTETVPESAPSHIRLEVADMGQEGEEPSRRATATVI